MAKRASKKSIQNLTIEGVTSVSDRIISLLEKDGIYSSSFDMLIANCAQLCCLRDSAFEILSKEGISIEELSREGEKRIKVHPCCSLFLETSKELRTALNDLKMTARTTNNVEKDDYEELQELMKEV